MTSPVTENMNIVAERLRKVQDQDGNYQSNLSNWIKNRADGSQSQSPDMLAITDFVVNAPTDMRFLIDALRGQTRFLEMQGVGASKPTRLKEFKVNPNTEAQVNAWLTVESPIVLICTQLSDRLYYLYHPTIDANTGISNEGYIHLIGDDQRVMASIRTELSPTEMRQLAHCAAIHIKANEERHNAAMSENQASEV